MKIGIYAPSKNEINHCLDWYNSCKEADVICVADTGSTDGTDIKLIELGVKVTPIRIIPWRFDLAFNFAMALLPDDIDVCIRLDLDERLQPGWREAIENAWTPSTTRLRYPYVWNWIDGKPGRTWYSDRIHAREGYIWRGATHEGLVARLPEVQTFTDDVKIWQFPDVKDKKDDLMLLLEATNEYPHDARLLAYLGREYMYQNQFENAINIYKKFLGMSYDSLERGQAYVNLSKCDIDSRETWLKIAAIEVPNHREPLVELAQYYHNQSDWVNCLLYAKRALTITTHPMDYTCTPEAWGAQPWELASIASWNMKLYQDSLNYAKHALEYSPNDKRLKNNVNIIQNFINEL